MCGIFGIVGAAGNSLSLKNLRDRMSMLFKLSASRGSEASGIAMARNADVRVLKQAATPRSFINSADYHGFFAGPRERERFVGDHVKKSRAFVVIGHTRMATNGSSAINTNNQPVVRDNLVAVHNGIVVNDADLWLKHPQLERRGEIDTEIILALLWFYMETEHLWIGAALAKVFGEIKGATNLAIVAANTTCLVLATNNGSLYTLFAPIAGIFYFASEEAILRDLVKRRSAREFGGAFELSQIKPGTALLVDTEDLSSEAVGLKDDLCTPKSFTELSREIIEISPSTIQHQVSISPQVIRQTVSQDVLAAVNRQILDVGGIRRCCRCILPETMPFVDFDDSGVCRYCRNFRPRQYWGKEALEARVSSECRRGRSHDSIICLSGGRDSSYCLHYMKKELGLNPVAYTYDWGMITDLARRNISRLCGELGIEHVLLSAKIDRKLSNIRKNVIAWLKKPDLGLVPLFMAGDKQFFYYGGKLRKKIGLDLAFLAESPFERTWFKTGFCGIAPMFNNERIYGLSALRKMQLAFYYMRGFLGNRAYLNSSMADSIFAYFSYYLVPHHFVYFYDYISWDEEDIVGVLRKEYDWECATDTGSTWRIGDGTASFYNFIYYMAAGFTENDTFRSHQIREGRLDRNRALELVRIENEPRWESIQWYCDRIGVDFEMAVRVVSNFSCQRAVIP